MDKVTTQSLIGCLNLGFCGMVGRWWDCWTLYIFEFRDFVGGWVIVGARQTSLLVVQGENQALLLCRTALRSKTTQHSTSLEQCRAGGRLVNFSGHSFSCWIVYRVKYEGTACFVADRHELQELVLAAKGCCSAKGPETLHWAALHMGLKPCQRFY